jgi:hypothetical protein
MDRYDQLNTLIVKDKHPLVSREFQNLDSEVVAKIGVKDGVSVFAVEATTKYMQYAKFTIGMDERYEGEFNYIDKVNTFEVSDGIWVLSGHYKPDEDFYIFYNKDSSIYVKTYSIQQGGFSQGILVREDATISSVEKFRDAFFFVIEDAECEDVYKSVAELGNAELKLLLLYEKDIERYILEEDPELYVQVLNSPFNDIGETSFTSHNMVDGQGMMYIENPDVINKFNEESINGNVFHEPGKVVVKGNKYVKDSTLTIRYSPLYEDEEYRTLILSDIYDVSYNGEFFVLRLNASSEVLYTKQIISEKEFVNLSVTTYCFGENIRVTLYVDGTPVVSHIIKLEDNPDGNSVYTFENIEDLDYLALQKTALDKVNILDLHNAFERDLLAMGRDVSLSFDGDKLNAFLDSSPDSHMVPFFKTDGEVKDITILVEENFKRIPFTTSTSGASGALSGSPTYQIPTSGASTSGMPTSGASLSGCNNVEDPFCNLNIEIPKFILNNDGTITRVDTQEMYAQEPAKINSIPTSQIANQASISTLGGYDNWTLPSSEDLTGFFSGTFSSSQNQVDFISGEDVTISGGALVENNTDFVIEEMVDNGRVWTSEGNWFQFGKSEDPDNYVWLKREIESEFEIRFVGSDIRIPISDKVSIREVVGKGIPILWRNTLYPYYKNANVTISYRERVGKRDIQYDPHYKLNNGYHYQNGSYYFIRKGSKEGSLGDTVLPFFFDTATGLPEAVYSDPTLELRLGNNISQMFNYKPFISELNTDIMGVTLWTSAKDLKSRLAVQYGLLDKDVSLTNTYSNYDTLSSQTYSPDSYVFAYHFDKLIGQSRVLIKDMTLDDCGEIILSANTDKNSYLREIRGMRFFGDTKRYRSTDYRIDVDVKQLKDRESYINNSSYIKDFITRITDRWAPATANLLEIRDRNTLIMANLLKDEFTQVLVGFTPTSNVNAYYIRSPETGQVSVLTSSANLDEEINWVGVGRIDTPYVKSGVTKIKKSSKNVKIFFETAFNNDNYRIFVFAPNNSIYYAPTKYRDGFLVESSSLVEDEVAWIALNTRQVINGTLDWKVGVPLGDTNKNHLDRYTEINENSNRYRLTFGNEGYPDFDNTDYSVILSADSNINLWVEDKQNSEFNIRRSYAGQNTLVNYLVVQGNSRWWENITS